MSYNQYLSGLIGSEVRINRGGPDSETGRLVYVHNDVLALASKQGVVYFNTQHIKSISEGGTRGNKSNKSGRSHGRYPIIRAYSFHNLLTQLKYQNVRINRGGPEKIEGLIVDVSNDYLIIVVKGELVRVPFFHIKTIQVLSSSKGNKSGQNQNQNQNQDKDKDKDKNQDKDKNKKTGGNRTGGNRTGGNRTGGSRTGGNKSGRC